MTGAMWKKIVLQAAETVNTYPYLMQMIDNPIADTMEAISVLTEVLPSLPEKQIEKTLKEIREMEIEPTVQDLKKLAVKKLSARTDEEMEMLDAEILAMAMEQLHQVELIDLNPSYHLNE